MSGMKRSFCVVSTDTLGVARIVGDSLSEEQSLQEADLYWDTIATDGEAVQVLPSDHPRLVQRLSQTASC